jgi:argonaute-like protein implicated in RNA metabolism and viral defense
LNKEKSLIVGFGFSRFPRIGKVSKCAAVAHDSFGNKISWDVFVTPTVERTINKDWFDRFLEKIRDFVDMENPTRLLLYRTGKLYNVEKEAIQKSIAEKDWLNDVKFTFVSVLDHGDFRICMNNSEYKNVPTGYGIIFNNKEAILATSNFDSRELKHGTVIPLHLIVDFGEDDIVDILKEYHDLTYLNWLAPDTTAKHPLVIELASRLASLTREGVPTDKDTMSYLDL